MNTTTPRTIENLIYAAQQAQMKLDVATEICGERLKAAVVALLAVKAALRTHACGKVIVTSSGNGKGWVAYHVGPSGQLDILPALFANDVPLPDPTPPTKSPGCECNPAVYTFLADDPAHSYGFGGHAVLNSGNGHSDA